MIFTVPSEKEFHEHLLNKSNPHLVTASQTNVSESVSQLFGLSGENSVDDVLSAISISSGGMRVISEGTYTGTGTRSVRLSFSEVPKLLYIEYVFENQYYRTLYQCSVLPGLPEIGLVFYLYTHFESSWEYRGLGSVSSTVDGNSIVLNYDKRVYYYDEDGNIDPDDIYKSCMNYSGYTYKYLAYA